MAILNQNFPPCQILSLPMISQTFATHDLQSFPPPFLGCLVWLAPNCILAQAPTQMAAISML